MKGLKLWEVLKALDEGKEIEFYNGEYWDLSRNHTASSLEERINIGTIYRIKPEIEVREYYFSSKYYAEGMAIDLGSLDDYKITIEFEDDEPICESIKMERLC
jgi:hypothetical protein